MIATIQFYEASQGTTRFYMSVERDAILGVHASSHGWHVIDHAAARPGSGRGHALRQMVFPALVAAADRQGITILTTAVNEQLARRYIRDLPGLIDVGPAPHGRRRLVRKPQAPEPQSIWTLDSTPASTHRSRPEEAEAPDPHPNTAPKTAKVTNVQA